MSNHLRDELRQRRPFQSKEQEAYLNIVRTAAGLTDGLERLLKPAGLSAPQYNVLRILRGVESGGLCRNELRDRLLTRMPDVSRLLDRMERAGLIARVRDTQDRRLVTTRITDQGLRLLEELDGLVAEEHCRRLGRLDREELETLIDLLERVRTSV